MVSSAKFRASTLSTPSAVQSHFAMFTENRMRLDDSLRNGSARDSLAADSSKPIATLSGRPLLSNRGIPLSLDWLKQVRINTSAVERRAQTHVARRTVKKDWQAAWLLRAISCMISQRSRAMTPRNVYAGFAQKRGSQFSMTSYSGWESKS